MYVCYQQFRLLMCKESFSVALTVCLMWSIIAVARSARNNTRNKCNSACQQYVLAKPPAWPTSVMVLGSHSAQQKDKVFWNDSSTNESMDNSYFTDMGLDALHTRGQVLVCHLSLTHVL